MFTLQEKAIDLVYARNSFTHSLNGALVSFEGIVRADKADSEVASLLYIADGPECLREGEAIIREVVDLFPINRALCIQRIGQVNAGETAIWIGVWSPHREEAFKGCKYVIEQTKKRLLIWKKEFYTDGKSQWIKGKDTPVIT